MINFDVDALSNAGHSAYSDLTDVTKLCQVYKSHIFSKVNSTNVSASASASTSSTADDGRIQYFIDAIIPLSIFAVLLYLKTYHLLKD